MSAREYPDRPWVGVGVVVWRGDEVLLVRRAQPPRLGEWGLPGGAQELGETLFEAAVREVAEETGVSVAPVGIITALDAIVPDADGRVRFHYTLVEVAARWLAGESAPRDDIDACAWVEPTEIAGLAAWEEVARVVALSRALVDAGEPQEA